MKIQKPHENFYDWYAATPDSEVWRIDWQKYGLPYCGVYVITPDNKWPCKVGISICPKKRLGQLQTALWMPVTMGAYRWCESAADARVIEQAAHRILKQRALALYGEWFDIRADEAAGLLETIALEEGIRLGSGVPKGQEQMVEDLEKMIFEGRARRTSIIYQVVQGKASDYVDANDNRRKSL